MRALAKFFSYQCSAIAAYLRSVAGINCNSIFTSVFNFVNNHSNEFPPRGIVNTFIQPTFSGLPIRRKTSIFIFDRLASFCHSFYIQIFIGNQIKSINKLSALFVQKIVSLICCFSMKVNKFLSFSVTFFNRIFRLNIFKFLFRFSQVFWIRNYFTIGKSSKIFKTRINSNSTCNCFLWNRYIFYFYGQTTIPLIAGFFNSAVFYFGISHNIPVNTKPYFANTRKIYSACGNCKTGLRIANRVKSILSFESWKTGCLPLFHSLRKKL